MTNKPGGNQSCLRRRAMWQSPWCILLHWNTGCQSSVGGSHPLLHYKTTNVRDKHPGKLSTYLVIGQQLFEAHSVISNIESWAQNHQMKITGYERSKRFKQCHTDANNKESKGFKTLQQPLQWTNNPFCQSGYSNMVAWFNWNEVIQPHSQCNETTTLNFSLWWHHHPRYACLTNRSTFHFLQEHTMLQINNTSISKNK